MILSPCLKKQNSSVTFRCFLLFLSHSEACFFSFYSFWVTQKRVFSPFALSEPLRSMFFLHLSFLTHSEACFFSICPFWVAQKHVFSPFALSESLRSMFFLFLPFLSRSEACFFSFCPFWVTQKLVFSPFVFSESLRSTYFLFFNASYNVCNTKIPFFMHHTMYVAWKFSFFRFIQCM